VDLDAAADRGGDLRGEFLEVAHELVARGEAVGVGFGEALLREPVVPGRPVGDQPVPALRAPALGDAVPLDDQMR